MLSILLEKLSFKILIFIIVLREQHFGLVPFFFFGFVSYDADLSLFMEIGKVLTCAVFTESVDLRTD